MNFLPDIEKAHKIADSGDFDILPVSTEILSDFITPIEAMRILKAKSKHAYILESVSADEKWG
ncbi:MAG: anthranilate synthase component I, partial [Clostridia bacterium]|nr:anthranilate synthase component I [Clostridia bacterium]